MRTIFINCKIVTENKVLENYMLITEKGLITHLLKEDQNVISKQDKVIDCKGQYLSPGFIDIHNHGNSGYDVMDATIEAIDSMAKFHACHGVTSFLGTTMTNPNKNIIKALENAKAYIELNEHKDGYSELLGIYLEGPYFNVLKKGAQPKEHIKNARLDEINQFIEISGNHINIIAIAPELEGSVDVIRSLREKNVYVTMGHSNATYEEAEAGIEAGASIATHLYNGMKSFSHREPSIVGSVLTNSMVRAELIVDLIHLHPGAIKLALKSKGVDGIILVSDAMRATGLSDGVYDLGGQQVIVTDGKARLADGTIAGSTLTLNLAVKNMINALGVSVSDAVKMASLNPAKSIGLENILGSIDIGKRADLVLFDEDINIISTWVKGKKNNG